MADLKKLAEELTSLTVLEVNDLKNFLKDEYGIEPVKEKAPKDEAEAAKKTLEEAGATVELA
jgi:large subunit ribosomal protein L7/L12